jgi:hypothetical protein
MLIATTTIPFTNSMLNTWIQPKELSLPAAARHISLDTSILTTESCACPQHFSINQLQPQRQVINCDVCNIICQNETMASKYGLRIMVTNTRKSRLPRQQDSRRAQCKYARRPHSQVEERKGRLPPCVLALLVEVSTLDLGGGGGWQVPTGQRRMQQPVATVVSSSPAALGDARRLLLPRRLRRHQPQRSRSRSSSPELSHPSNCPSSGGASPMALLRLLVSSPSRPHTEAAREPDRLQITFTARAGERQPARRSLRGTAESAPEIPRVPPPRQRRDPSLPAESGRITPGPGRRPRDPTASGASLARGAPWNTCGLSSSHRKTTR